MPSRKEETRALGGIKGLEDCACYDSGQRDMQVSGDADGHE